jgi:hypothetical protein
MEPACPLCHSNYENIAHPRTGAIMMRLCKCEYTQTQSGGTTVVVLQAPKSPEEESVYLVARYPQFNEIDLKEAVKMAAAIHAPLRKANPDDPATQRRALISLARLVAELQHLWC